MIQTAEKSIPCFFRCVFFLQSYSSKTFHDPRDLTEPAKKAKINKHRGQLTCPRAQPHFQIRLAPKFQDGVGNKKRSELDFINSSDLSKIQTEVKLKGNLLAQ